MFFPLRYKTVHREKRAELLRTDRKFLHGQWVDVHVYGPGSGTPNPDLRLVPAEMSASHRAEQEARRRDYSPRKELAYVGLPGGTPRMSESSPVPSRRKRGGGDE